MEWVHTTKGLPTDGQDVWFVLYGWSGTHLGFRQADGGYWYGEVADPQRDADVEWWALCVRPEPPR